MPSPHAIHLSTLCDRSHKPLQMKSRPRLLFLSKHSLFSPYGLLLKDMTAAYHWNESGRGGIHRMMQEWCGGGRFNDDFFFFFFFFNSRRSMATRGAVRPLTQCFTLVVLFVCLSINFI